MNRKQISQVHPAPPGHWVGDGFPVRSLFSYSDHGRALNPFLLLDYAGPADFPPATHRRGVGEHPHRGFETVTIVYQGEVEHRDSSGGGGVIGPGDVQWMTAGAGILHDEFHSTDFSRRGGTLEMVQLWVNLPARDKSHPARYQTLLAQQIPVLELPGGAGRIRVIAGELGALLGPAKIFSPLAVLDVRLNAGATAELPARPGWNSALVVLRGQVRVNDEVAAAAPRLLILSAAGDGLSLTAETDAVVLFLSGEPIPEPVVGHGPFVMNSPAEIQQAIEDFNRGRFGQLRA